MPKKIRLNAQSVGTQFLSNLDFTESQKQVDALMKAVLQDNTINANKIRFIQEQLHDQRYQINPKIIANKMFEHLDNTDIAPEEITMQME
ncbi:MAG: flagellar biosynthesis anti-sigma factor FlgM [Gammaproteobacteria bacterium]